MRRAPGRGRWATRVGSLCAFAVSLAGLMVPLRGQAQSAGQESNKPPSDAPSRGCPNEMARIGRYCIDRWEIATVDHATGQPLSPYYAPAAPLVRFAHAYWSVEAGRIGDERVRRMPLPPVPAVQQGRFSPRAVSRPGMVPQGYLSYHTARLACENAGKRLCTEEEWVRACKGPGARRHGHSDNYVAGVCNVNRNQHPAFVLHGNSSVGHLDPRLNLLVEPGVGPLLQLTGESPRCSVVWNERAVYDMVGNLDEWIADEDGVFVGGFYARGTTQGCEARIANHAPAYYDYSTGTRCCRDAG